MPPVDLPIPYVVSTDPVLARATPELPRLDQVLYNTALLAFSHMSEPTPLLTDFSTAIAALNYGPYTIEVDGKKTGKTFYLSVLKTAFIYGIQTSQLSLMRFRGYLACLAKNDPAIKTLLNRTDSVGAKTHIKLSDREEALEITLPFSAFDRSSRLSSYNPLEGDSILSVPARTEIFLFYVNYCAKSLDFSTLSVEALIEFLNLSIFLEDVACQKRIQETLIGLLSKATLSFKQARTAFLKAPHYEGRDALWSAYVNTTLKGLCTGQKINSCGGTLWF